MKNWSPFLRLNGVEAPRESLFPEGHLELVFARLVFGRLIWEGNFGFAWPTKPLAILQLMSSFVLQS
jgi:hypothetical protein